MVRASMEFPLYMPTQSKLVTPVGITTPRTKPVIVKRIFREYERPEHPGPNRHNDMKNSKNNKNWYWIRYDPF